MSKKNKKEFECDQKEGEMEHIVRSNLMNLVFDAEDNCDPENEKVWKRWLEEAIDPLEGMCVGWSLMFIEDEDLTTKLWKNLQEKDLKITNDDKKTYQDFGKKLWYRYTNETCELEDGDKKREFSKLPLKSTGDVWELRGVKKLEDKAIKNVKEDDELYMILSKKIIDIIEEKNDSKKRHYIKIDNERHSMVVAFNAFKSNKGRVVIETERYGIEDIEYDNNGKRLKEILMGAFGKKVAETNFSLEIYSRDIENIKTPGLMVSKASIVHLSQRVRDI